MKNELIIFDFFGVFCTEVAPVWFLSRYPHDEAMRLKDKYFVKADLGEVTMDELFDEMSRDLGIPVNVIKAEWAPLFELNYPLFDYVEKLRKHYTVILLSNAPLGLLDDLLDSKDLRKYFEKVFISCHMKIAKPNLDIYRRCIASYTQKFDKIYMVDDNINNLKPLDAIGVTPIHFKSNSDVYAAFPLD